MSVPPGRAVDSGTASVDHISEWPTSLPSPQTKLTKLAVEYHGLSQQDRAGGGWKRTSVRYNMHMREDEVMRATDIGMVPLGYGRFVRADDIVAVLPIEDGRGRGRRTYVHVAGLAAPVVASRSEAAILADMKAAGSSGRFGPDERRAPGSEHAGDTAASRRRGRLVFGARRT